MPSDPPNEPPTEATVPPAEPPEPAPAVEAPPPAVPPEPVSKVKEWAVAFAIMIVFAIICAQFIGFLRSNQLGGP
jgi:hypothetical protein